jgi:hypothetical protein
VPIPNERRRLRREVTMFLLGCFLNPAQVTGDE